MIILLLLADTVSIKLKFQDLGYGICSSIRSKNVFLKNAVSKAEKLLQKDINFSDMENCFLFKL